MADETVLRPSIDVQEIRWTVPPVSRLEDVDVLTLDEPELLAHISDWREDSRWIRRTLHEAITQTATLTTRLRRALAIIQEQRRQNPPRRVA